jgi:hypothetical protein
LRAICLLTVSGRLTGAGIAIFARETTVRCEFCTVANQINQNETDVTASRAVVCVGTGQQYQSAVREPSACASLANAAFLAQLIACGEGFAPYRARRRAAPAIAANAYRRACALAG